MHPNPAFRTEPTALNLQFARERGFGTLSIADNGTPRLAHVPFCLSEDGTTADLHLLRSNPISRAMVAEAPAVLAVTGPDSFVSPDWYGVDDQVPTWNYVAVHLTGRLVPLPDTALRDSLERLSATFEDRLRPKQPWTLDKLPADTLARMMRTLRPFRLVIDRVDGTWKLNQNKPEAARMAAADHIDAYGIGQDTALLAGLVRSAGD